MKCKNPIWIFFLFCISLNAQEEKKDSIDIQKYKVSETESYVYDKLKFSDLYEKIPCNIANTAKDMVSSQTLPYTFAASGATIALIPLDPYLTRESRKLAIKLGFEYDHSYKNIGPLKIIPQNTNSLLYFLGNGTSVILMSGGFAAYGFICNDYRAQNVSSQLFQSILLSGVFSQTLKRITGRESPFITAEENKNHSKWHPFPSFSAYQKDTSRYDGMPSGHLTTGLAAWIVIAENYPEKKWIKPVGFTVLGLMSFEMVQSGVHWTSDYPIAILFGYLIGKNIAKTAIKKENTVANEFSTKNKYHFNLASSSINGHQTFGVNVNF
jgi:membrane-associated phospholipid phosphatase